MQDSHCTVCVVSQDSRTAVVRWAQGAAKRGAQIWVVTGARASGHGPQPSKVDSFAASWWQSKNQVLEGASNRRCGEPSDL